MPILGVRVWRTTDGRHVLDGHLDAAILAYGTGDDVPEHIAQQLLHEPEPAPDPGPEPDPETERGPDSAPELDGAADTDPEAEADPQPEPEQKAQPPAANKSRKAAGNK